MIKYRWATLGCGVIANQLAQALQAQGSNLYWWRTAHMTRQLHSQKSTASKKSMRILMKFLQMTTVILSLHAKQPKRGLIAFDKGYVELYEYPRGQEAVITYTKDGHTETIREGETNRTLEYEVQDMEAAVAGEKDDMHLDYTRDVMDMMTQIRQEWGMRYPEEE